jgi:hypothetical protein
MKEVIIKDDQAFRLRVKSWKCVRPSELNAVEFIQESKNTKQEVEFSSTYQFFMTNEELKKLANDLLSIHN